VKVYIIVALGSQLHFVQGITGSLYRGLQNLLLFVPHLAAATKELAFSSLKLKEITG
jgi:hypothetical protein